MCVMIVQKLIITDVERDYYWEREEKVVKKFLVFMIF